MKNITDYTQNSVNDSALSGTPENAPAESASEAFHPSLPSHADVQACSFQDTKPPEVSTCSSQGAGQTEAETFPFQGSGAAEVPTFFPQHTGQTETLTFPSQNSGQSETQAFLSQNSEQPNFRTFQTEGFSRLETPAFPPPNLRLQEQERLLAPVSDSFPFFAGLSLLFGFIFTFCLYRNPCGITYPLFTAFACFCGVFSCRKLQVPMKKGSWFLLAAALLIGLSTCRTADEFLITFNGIALVLLGCVFALHQFYDDTSWNIGKYMASVFCYLFQAVGAASFPFRHLNRYLKSQDNKIIKQIPTIFLGFLAALPVLAVLVWLLSSADFIFSDLVSRLFWNFLRPATMLGLLLRFLFGALSLYCLVCSCCLRGIPENSACAPKGNPLAAVSGLFMIAFVYVIFCVIQIVCLFLGKGALLEGYTYSGYARQGFFQLLAVAFLNLVMVLCCLRYIRPHKAIRLLLTVICGCTYIMIASACFRMALYVREYHLTYLRLLVLWFLAMLALLMAGVTRIVWNRRFPLFRYGLAVVSAFYIALAWARPDSVIAWDYVNHLETAAVTQEDLYYLTSRLSADAAPAIASLTDRCQAQDTDPDLLWGWKDFYYQEHSRPQYRTLGLRNYNFSLAKARQLFFNSQ